MSTEVKFLPVAAARSAAKVAVSATIEDGEDRLIRDAECERLSGLSRTTRWRLERKGRFPRRRQLSDNAVGWLLSEVLAWRCSLTLGTQAPTSALTNDSNS